MLIIDRFKPNDLRKSLKMNGVKFLYYAPNYLLTAKIKRETLQKNTVSG
jgi:hypothetical protein